MQPAEPPDPAPAARDRSAPLRIALLVLAAFACFYLGWASRHEPVPTPAAPPTVPALLTSSPDVPNRVLDSLLAAYAPFVHSAADAPDSLEIEAWTDSMMAVLSLDQQIGQLFLVDLNRRELRGLRTIDEAVTSYHVGGFLVPRLMEPYTVLRETNRLQRLSVAPLFFAADYERGAGRHNNNFTEFPANMGVGAARDPDLARVAGMITAIEARATGVNWLFAPVVDVNNNPDNPIINIRSYGESPELVGQMAAAFVEGVHTNGVLATLKHFPGHGNTATDSHEQLGVVPGDRAALDSLELHPYRMTFGAATFDPAVMTAHLWVQGLDPQARPATVSPVVLQDVLRDSLGFAGIVVTDHIRMGALSQTYSYAERVVQPLAAGADVILGPNDLEAARAAVRQALADGALPRDRFEASVRRVLRAKAAIGLHRERLADRTTLRRLLRRPLGEPLARLIADEAVTLLRGGGLLPLPEERSVALVQLANSNQSSAIRAAMDALADRLEDRYTLTNHALTGRMTKTLAATALADAEAADIVVLALYLRVRIGGPPMVEGLRKDLVDDLVASGKPLVLVTFGNPYIVDAVPSADGVLVAYDQSLASIDAVAHILTGEQPPQGRFPISIRSYPYGSGRAPSDLPPDLPTAK